MLIQQAVIRHLRVIDQLSGFFQVLFVPIVVGIEKGQPVAGGVFDAAITRGGGVAEGRLKQRQVKAGGFDLLSRVIARVVVDDDDFIGRAGLRINAVLGALDPRSTVVTGNDDRNPHSTSHSAKGDTVRRKRRGVFRLTL